MKEIVVKVSNDNARYWLWLLRRRYGKDKRTSLTRLVKIAVLEAVASESKKVVDETI